MSANQTNQGTLAQGIEQSINAALTMDASAQKHLKRLYGCTLTIHISSTHSTFQFGVKQTEQEYQIQLLPNQNASDVQISGSILAFIKLASSSDRQILFRTREIDLRGDSVRIQQIQAFLAAVSIDWEAILANFIGDVPAHFLGSTLRSSLGWGKTLTQSLFRDAEEYIKYELRLFPNKARAKKQFSAIEELSKATEQLEKRFASLTSSILKREKHKISSTSTDSHECLDTEHLDAEHQIDQ